jgi:hypothetical protein
MAELEPITDPSFLQTSKIVTGLASLSIGTSRASPELASPKPRARLALLQPLAKPGMLEACRNPASQRIYNSDRTSYSHGNHEYLNIQPLCKAWRKALMEVPPIPHLTFDLALPKAEETSKDSFQRVYWDVAIPGEGGLGVLQHDVNSLIITIATVMRMRTEGDVLFEVIWDQADKKALRKISLLEKQLRALSDTGPPKAKVEE